MCVAPRGYTDKELKRIQKSYTDIGAGNVLKTGDSAHFKDRTDRMELEQGVAKEIEKSFKTRLETLEELHKREHGIISDVKEQDAKVKTQQSNSKEEYDANLDSSSDEEAK